jgi:hypothetical protein
VLYYYRCSASIAGGALEFLDKTVGATEKSLVWDGDDWTELDTRAMLESTPHGSVTVAERTMMVFSNQQVIHRVLRMVHRGPDGDPGPSAGVGWPSEQDHARCVAQVRTRNGQHHHHHCAHTKACMQT